MITKKQISFGLVLLIIFCLYLPTTSFAITKTDEIIGIVNNEELTASSYIRLLNARKNKFYEKLNFDLFSPNNNFLDSLSERENYLAEAKKQGLTLDYDVYNDALNNLIKETGGVEKLIEKAQKANIAVPELKKKLEENVLLEEYFERYEGSKLVDQMVNELLVLQEAKEKNIQAAPEEIIKRLNQIIEKEGGVLPFTELLAKNNATVQDAENEIKKQIIFEILKNDLENSGITMESFIKDKKSKSNIVIYTNKITDNALLVNNESSTDSEANKQLNAENTKEAETINTAPNPSLRTNPYPTITKSKIETIEKLEEKTSQIVEEIKQLENNPSEAITKDNLAHAEEEISDLPNGKLLPKLFRGNKSNEDDVPLLTQEQSKFIDNYIKSRQPLVVEETSEPVLVKQDGPKEQTQNKKIEVIKDKDESEIEIADITEPKTLKPVEKAENAVLSPQIKKDGVLKLYKNAIANLKEVTNEKLTSSKENIKNKINKVKLASKNKKKDNVIFEVPAEAAEVQAQAPPAEPPPKPQVEVIPQEPQVIQAQAPPAEPPPKPQVKVIPQEPQVIQAQAPLAEPPPKPQAEVIPQEPQVIQAQVPPVESPSKLQDERLANELNTLNVFKTGKSNLKDMNSPQNLSKELEELRKKIEQRRILNKK